MGAEAESLQNKHQQEQTMINSFFVAWCMTQGRDHCDIFKVSVECLHFSVVQMTLQPFKSNMVVFGEAYA